MKNFNSLIQRVMGVILITYDNSYFNFIGNIMSLISWIEKLDLREVKHKFP